MQAISQILEGQGASVAFLEPTELHSNSGAVEAIGHDNVHWIANDDFTSIVRSPNLVLTMNDWDQSAAHLLEHCKQMGIGIIGLQEGTTDFLRNNWGGRGYCDPERLPYTKSDFLLLASNFDATYFPNRPHTVIGMDRVEPLFAEDVSFPEQPIVLINLNFSYKVCLEFSRDWLVSVTKTCEALGFEYVLSVHPQDETDVSGFEDKIDTAPLHELLKKSTLFVSRFSNAIYESLALGKPVVYFNPHNEKSRTFNEPEGAFSVARSDKELLELLKYEITQRDIRERAQTYFESHLSLEKSRSSAERAADAILNLIREKPTAPFIQPSPGNAPDISIIVPAYNVAPYLDRCIDSLCRQTCQNTEIILIDDCSTDHTGKIMTEYARRDARLTTNSLTMRSGQSRARNIGMMRARGKAIMFVDGDDWLAPDACEKALAELQASRAEVVLFDLFEYLQPKSKIIQHFDFDEVKKPGFDRSELLKICSPCTKIYQTDFLRRIGAYFPEAAIFEDWFWTLQWATQARKISAISDPLYYYRKNRPGSTTTGNRSEVEAMRGIIRNLDMSKRYLDNRGLNYRSLSVLINKADARVRNDATISEHDRLACYGMLAEYLRSTFYLGLPAGVTQKSIRKAYAAHKPGAHILSRLKG